MSYLKFFSVSKYLSSYDTNAVFIIIFSLSYPYLLVLLYSTILLTIINRNILVNDINFIIKTHTFNYFVKNRKFYSNWNFFMRRIEYLSKGSKMTVPKIIDITISRWRIAWWSWVISILWWTTKISINLILNNFSGHDWVWIIY